MRAREIPKLLFRQIAEALGIDPEDINLEDKEAFKCVTLREYQIIIGYGSTESQGRIFTWVKVARIDLKEGEEIKSSAPLEDALNRNQLMKIIAGPFSQGVWEAGRGRMLGEMVKINFGADFYMTGADLNQPVMRAIHTVLGMALDLLAENPPQRQQYWEAFLNPNADYSQPP